MPIGALPAFLQTAIRFFYPSHGAALLRQIMMEDVLQQSFSAGTPRSFFEEQFGLFFHYGEHLCTSFESIGILAGCGIIFFLLANLRMHKLRS